MLNQSNCFCLMFYSDDFKELFKEWDGEDEQTDDAVTIETVAVDDAPAVPTMPKSPSVTTTSGLGDSMETQSSSQQITSSDSENTQSRRTSSNGNGNEEPLSRDVVTVPGGITNARPAVDYDNPQPGTSSQEDFMSVD